MIDYWKSFTPVAQAGTAIAGSAVMGYVFGALAPNGSSIRNTFDNNPNNTASWVTPNGTLGQADPIGGTTAVALTGTFQMLRSVGSAVLPVCCQVFVKVTSSTPSEFQLEYWNNGVSRVVRTYSFSGTTDWMLLTLDAVLDGMTPAPTTAHEFRITGGSGKVTIWWPQIAQGTRLPQPILPLDGGGSSYSIGTGMTPNFSQALRMVGVGDYELPKVVKRLSFTQAASPVTSPPLVDATSTGAKAFEVVVREVQAGGEVLRVYHALLSYAAASVSADAIKQVSGPSSDGDASLVALTLSALTANTAKSLVFTTSGTTTVQATIREIT
jgi:hypothetical protein